LLDRRDDAIPASAEIVYQMLRLGIAANGNRQVDISREAHVTAHGHRQSSDEREVPSEVTQRSRDSTERAVEVG
jgi:hypothetical protein